MRDMTSHWQPQIPMDPKWIHLWMDITNNLSPYRKLQGYTVASHKRVHELKNQTTPPAIPPLTVVEKWAILHSKDPLANEVAEYAREYVSHCFKNETVSASTSQLNGHLGAELRIQQLDLDE